jgi:amino acid adenylation domain-containing protein
MTQTIAGRVKAVAADFPDRAALAWDGGESTYAQLIGDAEKVAACLENVGVKEGDLVGISMRRGPGQVVGVLGTLLAGCAFVPLPPDDPVARVERVLENAAPAVALTGGIANDALRRAGIMTIAIDSALSAPTAAHRSAASPAGSSLAYVLYTSGTTGIPKGVEVENRGICALADALGALYERHSVRRVLQVGPITFDSWIFETLCPLACGLVVSLLTEEPARSAPIGVMRAASAANADLITITPSYLLGIDPAEVDRPPKVVVVAGERCSPELVRRWLPRAAVYNAYGPTEITVCATMHHCTSDDVESVPIGLPLPHVDAVIAYDGREAPDGVVGELFLGGPSVARGYRKLPELTADRFGPAPLQGKRGRFFATGDLATRRSDGSLVFMGRNDRQVKVRGQRVELDDVELALLEMLGVKHAVVLPVEDEELVVGLAAFVEGAAAARPDWLRRQVAAHRPAFMVPSLIVEVSEWPVTTSGKVDEVRLRAMLDQTPAADMRPGDANAGATVDDAIRHIWSELLKIDSVPEDADFFDLGGNSALAVRLASLVRQRLGVRLPIQAVFKSPTLAGFTGVVETARLES